jgi:hypothetical protein
MDTDEARKRGTGALRPGTDIPIAPDGSSMAAHRQPGTVF